MSKANLGVALIDALYDEDVETAGSAMRPTDVGPP